MSPDDNQEREAVALPEVLPGHWETAEGLDKAREYAVLQRSDLSMADRTDLGLANALYLVNGHLPIQTAAKERMRWLSVQLALAQAKIARLRSGGEGWQPIEEAEDRFVLAAIDHGGTMVTVRAERIGGGGYHDTREGSSVGWRPGRNQRGFFKPWPMFEAAPSPSTHGEG